MAGRREIALIAASVVFAGVIAEIGLRMAEISYPVFHKLEALRGWAPRPDITGVWMTEGKAYIANNKEGFRDRDHAIAKPPGVFRIAVIGDSMTEALAVPVEQTYWSILEQRLNACGVNSGRTVEVLTFGVSGHGTAQERLTLGNNALKYAPDLVLLAFFTGNDVLNNERALDGHKDRVYFVLEDGALRLDDSNTGTTRFRLKMLWRGALNGLINASQLFQLIREFYTRTKTSLRAEEAPDGRLFNPKAREYEVFRKPDSPDWRRAWKTTEALLTAMRDDSAAKGADFWITTLSAPVQVYPDPALRRDFARSLGVENLDYPDRRIADFAKGEGIPVVTLIDPLRAFADANKAYLHGFENTRLGMGHWNEAGHRAGGEALAKAVCASGVLAKP